MGDAVFTHFLFHIRVFSCLLYGEKACEVQENVIISLECTQTYTMHKHDTEIQEGQGRFDTQSAGRRTCREGYERENKVFCSEGKGSSGSASEGCGGKTDA